MDTGLKIYVLLPFFHVTYSNCMPVDYSAVDYSAEALKILNFEDIKNPSPREKRLARRLVFERNKAMELTGELALTRHKTNVLQMEMCLGPVIADVERLIVPYWLRSMDCFAKSTIWVISMALELTPLAKLFVEALRSRGISIREFEFVIGGLYELFSEQIAYGKWRNPPKDLTEDDWEVIYRKTGIVTYVEQTTIKMIILTLHRSDDMQYLQYTTTTVSPRVHQDVLLLIREKLPFKGDENETHWEATFRKWCGLEPSQIIDNIYFPMEEENRKLNGMVYLRMNNFEGDIVKMINTLKISTNKPDLKYTVDGPEGFQILEQLLSNAMQSRLLKLGRNMTEIKRPTNK